MAPKQGHHAYAQPPFFEQNKVYVPVFFQVPQFESKTQQLSHIAEPSSGNYPRQLSPKWGYQVTHKLKGPPFAKLVAKFDFKTRSQPAGYG